jgi:hypothetical protein
MNDTNQSDRKEDRESFKRLATKRTNKALKHVRLIGNLSNRSNYYYTESDVKKIFTALRTSINEAEALFKKTTPQKFKLEDL